MDGLHIEGMTEDELDLLVAAKVSNPIPGEDALDADDEVVTVGFDRRQKVVWSTPHVLVEKNLPISIENAEVHGLGVQIDPAVVLVGLGVESHGSLLKRLGLLVQPAYAVWRRHRRGPG
jgi:hypothetical protein